MNTFSKSGLILTLIAWSTCATAQIYSITELPTLGGSNGTYPYAVNDSGQVAGWSYLPDNATRHAFQYSNGTIYDLGTLSGVESWAYAINNSGQITGESLLGNSNPRDAFLYSNGVMQDLGTLPGDTMSAGFGINATGQVAGNSGPGSTSHAFLFNNNSMQDLGTLGGNSYASSVNDASQIIGTSNLTNGTQHAVIFSNGSIQDLGTLGGTSSRGTSINSSGQAVGDSSLPGNSAQDAFIYDGAAMADLGTLGGAQSWAFGISDAGQVVGYADLPKSIGNGPNHAFLDFGGTMLDLNKLIDPSSPLAPFVTLGSATGISNSNDLLVIGISRNGKYIVANGTDSRYPGVSEAFLLTLESNAPTVSPVITGKLGTNGWYTAATTTVAWTVTGFPIPTMSGCGKVSVPQTTGTTYICSATNSSGTSSDSVMIKEDSVKPSVVIKKPAANAVYALNQKVLATYSCLDATSGVASCVGTAVNGAFINTSALGQQSFTVTGTDNAGNTIAKTVLYSVDPGTATPMFSLKAGTYTGTQQVSITDATTGAAVYFTTNGNTPTLSSRVYSGPITIKTTTTLKARAIATNDAWSAVKTATYTIQ